MESYRWSDYSKDSDMPTCPNCRHHNAMFGPYKDESGEWCVFQCRDCKVKVRFMDDRKEGNA